MNPITSEPKSRGFFRGFFFKNFPFFPVYKIQVSGSNGVTHLIPNALSFSRIILFVVVVDLLSLEFFLLALIVFCLAMATDFLDGLLARFLRATSTIGAILDPLADKVLYLGSLWALRDFAPTTLGFLLTLPSEVMLIAVRFPPLQDRWKAEIPATWIGKVKVGIQYMAIVIMIFGSIIKRKLVVSLGVSLVLGAVIFSWASLYSHCSWRNKAVPL